MMPRLRRSAGLAAPVLALVTVAASGCGGSGPSVGSDRWPDASASAVDRDDNVEWPFWPRRMRIHPLSQIVTDRDSGQLLIEARVEFEDGDGQTAKAVGQVLLDLHGVRRGGDPVATWTVDLADLEVNRSHYDDLTRTYLVRLEIEPTILPEAPELRAYFRSNDGLVLTARPYELRR